MDGWMDGFVVTVSIVCRSETFASNNDVTLNSELEII